MKAEVIVIGDEILIGQTIDTNSAWIGNELSLLGFDIDRKTAIHDKRDSIIKALSDIKATTDIVIISGGLGPTSDDITKPVLCEFFNTTLVRNPDVLTMIETMMARRGWAMNDNNRRQADVPASCTVLTNAVGTAPGMMFRKDNTYFFSLPGVPNEMKHIMIEHIIPWIKLNFSKQVIIHKNIMTYGAGEAILSELLSAFEAGLPPEIKLAYLPSLGIVKLRLTATGTNRDHLEKLIDGQVGILRKTIPDLIFATTEEPFEKVIAGLLTGNRKTLATAESCTGGKIAQMITSIPGSSAYFKGSVIAYSNEIKTSVLGVPLELINKYGAVSREVVESMAENARQLMNADYAVATSGIAGPGGGTEQKPVGLLWVAVASEKATYSEKFIYGNDRNTTISRFSTAALNMLRKHILQDEKDS